MNPENITIVIADDHMLIREGFESLLSKMPGCELVGVCKDGLEAQQSIRMKQPDIALLDIFMPGLGGIELARKLRDAKSATRVIFISSFDNDSIIEDVLDSGAKGYVLKSAGTDQIEKAIRKVMDGGDYYCIQAVEMYTRYLKKKRKFGIATRDSFNEREINILNLICRQMTTREIGKELFLSEKTIENIRASMMSKMGVKNLAGMIIFAIREGLIDIKEIE